MNANKTGAFSAHCVPRVREDRKVLKGIWSYHDTASSSRGLAVYDDV